MIFRGSLIWSTCLFYRVDQAQKLMSSKYYSYCNSYSKKNLPNLICFLLPSISMRTREGGFFFLTLLSSPELKIFLSDHCLPNIPDLWGLSHFPLTVLCSSLTKYWWHPVLPLWNSSKQLIHCSPHFSPMSPREPSHRSAVSQSQYYISKKQPCGWKLWKNSNYRYVLVEFKHLEKTSTRQYC